MHACEPRYNVRAATKLEMPLVEVNVACCDNAETNAHFKKVYLATRVEVDTMAEKQIKASDFARVYTGLLSRPEIKSCWVSVAKNEDLGDLKYKKKIA